MKNKPKPKTKKMPHKTKPKTSCEPDLSVLTLTATTPNKNPSQGQRSLGRVDLSPSPWLGGQPPILPPLVGAREGKRECASLQPQPPALGQRRQGTAWG